MSASLVIQDIYNIPGMDLLMLGTVKSGNLKKGMKLDISGKIMLVKALQANDKQIAEAKQGDFIGLSLQNGDFKLLSEHKGKEVRFS